MTRGRKTGQSHMRVARSLEDVRRGGRRRLMIFGVLAGLLLLFAALSPLLTPMDPYAQDLSEALLAPGGRHLLGTDRYGRDVLSRVILGSRLTIWSALFTAAAAAAFGTLVGLFAGYAGGAADTILMRVSDVFLAFPSMVFAIAVCGVMGGGMKAAVVAVSMTAWPKYARLARARTLSIRQAPYIRAARLAGSGAGTIMLRHILPNLSGTILVTASMDIGTILIQFAGLSFLGLGAAPPAAEWGLMMSSDRNLLQAAPWTVLAPGAAIFASVAVFNLFGDALRDAWDPRDRR